MDDMRVNTEAVLAKYIDALSQANYTITLLTVMLEEKQKEIELLKGVNADENMVNKCT